VTKKHFEAAAAIVRGIRQVSVELRNPYTPTTSKLVRENDLNAISAESAYIELFTQFNPRFDAERFRAACQPK
jgi:hypothetical protein